MKSYVLTAILSTLCSIYAMSEVDSLLIKGDEYYFKGNLEGALDLYFQAESFRSENEGAKEGIYNASINSGGIKTANEYAYKLLKIQNSQINQDRVIYSDALLGKTSAAEKFLKQEKDYYRKKAIYSLAGWGLKQTGYSIKTADWYKKAMDDGFKSDEFAIGYRESSKLVRDDNKYLDATISLYNYGGNDLLTTGYNLNLNYNFGPSQHKFNINLVMQGTGINQDMNMLDKIIISGADTTYSKYDSKFYDTIGQYELFGQYNYFYSRRLTVYGGAKLSWLNNDYIQSNITGSIGSRFKIGDYFRANTYFNASAVSYSYFSMYYDSTVTNAGQGNSVVTYKIDYKELSGSLSSLQYTFDGAFTYNEYYIGGIINVIKDLNSTFAEDMEVTGGRTDLSENINDRDIRLLYGVTAGYNNNKYDIFSSYTTGDLFLVNTSEGRYLNTIDSKLKMNVLGGIIFKKLFGDWILGYTLSYSDFENYTILTNSIIANYNWR